MMYCNGENQRNVCKVSECHPRSNESESIGAFLQGHNSRPTGPSPAFFSTNLISSKALPRS